MANELIKQNYKDIANAIREKTGENAVMTASEMPAKIASIPTGVTPSGTISITTNGTHDVTNYASASVSVQPQYESRYISSNGEYDVADYRKVNVQVSQQVPVLDGTDGNRFLEIVFSDTNKRDKPDYGNYIFGYASSSYAKDGGDVTLTNNYLDLSTEGLRVMATSVSDYADINILPGGHYITHPSQSEDENIVVVGVITGESAERGVGISIGIEYYSYSDSYTESEIEEMWQNKLIGVKAYDLNGYQIGTIDSVSCSITLSGDC